MYIAEEKITGEITVEDSIAAPIEQNIDFAYHSQLGEDKIVHAFLERLGIGNGFFVEFGAWDGKYFSNTYFLYKMGWGGCYIEGDQSRMRQLEYNCPDARALKICAFVASKGQFSLDNILQENGTPPVDVLSIDIDGDDYAVWKSVSTFLPKIVVIEYNPSIPFDTRYINPLGASHGSSALSLKDLSESKGYILVAGTLLNLIFMRRDLAKKHDIVPVTLQSIRDTTPSVRYFFAYDGTLVQVDDGLPENFYGELLIVPWADCPIPQPIPKLFRKLRSGWGTFQVVRLIYCSFWSFMRSPTMTVKYVIGRVSNRRSARLTRDVHPALEPPTTQRRT